MPYQKRNTYPNNTQHNRIRFDTIAACILGRVPYESEQAMRGVRQCLLALQKLPLALHIESFATEKFHLVSDAFAQMHGYSPDELEAVLLSDLCVPECQEKFEHFHHLALQAGDAVFDTEHERKDGSRFPVHVEMYLLRQERDEAMLSVVSEDTETEVSSFADTQQQERYARAFEKLRLERDQAHQQMRANTHLTRNHLEMAAGMTDLVLNAWDFGLSPEELQAYRNEITMLTEVYGILYEGQRAGDWSHQVPLRSLLEKQLTLWKAPYPDRPFEQEIVDVRLHVRQFLTLVNALREIVKNAFVHGAGCVRVAITEYEEEVTVIVQDQGPGFPSDFQPRTGAGEIGSTNTLGLGVVSRTQSGFSPIQGEVRYENRPEGGAQVLLRFTRL